MREYTRTKYKEGTCPEGCLPGPFLQAAQTWQYGFLGQYWELAEPQLMLIVLYLFFFSVQNSKTPATSISWGPPSWKAA